MVLKTVGTRPGSRSSCLEWGIATIVITADGLNGAIHLHPPNFYVARYPRYGCNATSARLCRPCECVKGIRVQCSVGHLESKQKPELIAAPNRRGAYYVTSDAPRSRPRFRGANGKPHRGLPRGQAVVDRRLQQKSHYELDVQNITFLFAPAAYGDALPPSVYEQHRSTVNPELHHAHISNE
jgi:hypothetical protein